MKEVKEWNNKPRYMWVWDISEIEKYKMYVVYILSKEEMKEANTNYPIMTVGNSYKHCAEIEEEPKKETRLTHYELCQLLKCFGVEMHDSDCSCDCDVICNAWSYLKHNINEKLPEGYKIRYKQGEWEEPTRETVWKWWGEEVPNSDIARFVSFMGWDNWDKE